MIKSFIITLSRVSSSLRSARNLKQQLEQFEMPAELFEGTYGDEAVSIMEQEGRTPHPWGIKGPESAKPNNSSNPHPSSLKILRPGVKGCFLSHYRLWQKCVELDEPIIIWEDDIILTRPFEPVDWQDILVVALGHPTKSMKYLSLLEQPEGIPAAIHYDRASMPGCCGYAIKPHAARKLLEVYDNTFLPADNAINQYHVKIQIHNYIMGTAVVEGKKSLTSSSSFWNNPQPPNLVFASYFTGTPDPQRNRSWTGITSELIPLITSVTSQDVGIKIFHDCFDEPPEIKGCEWIRCNDDLTGVFTASVLRWFRYLQYLKKLEFKPRALFMVDSTDVQMLRNPFPEMDLNTLYCGDEYRSLVSCDWLHRRSKYFAAPDYKEVIEPHGQEQLLNAGIVGSGTDTCIHFLKRLTDYHTRYNTVRDASLSLDMPVFNYTVWKHFSDRVVHGDPVNTRFKRNEHDETRWWKHK